MRISWETAYLGTFNMFGVPEDEVMAKCESLIALGFTPEVTLE